MKLDAYLSPSRHGVYYFRWPLPQIINQPRRTIRLSLYTRCPEMAGELSRYLASCGCLIRNNKALAKLRHDEMREMVRSYFHNSLARRLEQLNNTGFTEFQMVAIQNTLDFHEE
ncbi:MAG: hypothetical protein JKX71_06925 [Amylibacter sp.]|nr:hypothetical protein [Amylibacter sp.]